VDPETVWRLPNNTKEIKKTLIPFFFI